mmetsp:Transcript_17420/g.32870  ORF Transcript_17420/g.32870 Transcript_17420/m.32870 type:complete len:495 (-) Transcript_17420:94-1578(-)
MSYKLHTNPSSMGGAKKAKKYTRSGGAKSGTESYFIGAALMLALGPLLGLKGLLAHLFCMLTVQLLLMSKMERTFLWHSVFSQKLGPKVMRNASIGFAECVRPGGKPTSDHCLSLYNYSGPMTTVIFAFPLLLLLTFSPAIAFVRLFYPEHWWGVPKSRLQLFWYFLRHPSAIQGEGPSNGDGLAAMNGSESIAYPITKKELEQGPLDVPYWLGEGKRPRLRDMFHDKLFCHRFFESHGAPHPVLVAEVAGHKRREIFLTPDKAPKKLLWKPRYSTMGLGVEKFTGWEDVDDGKDWAPSSVPYIIEELIESTEYEAAEWYRMTTLWEFDEVEPKPGYIWQHRNSKDDSRIQTDIIGGQCCVTSKYTPFVGPTEKGMAHNTRAGTMTPLLPAVDRGLTKAIDLQLKMHKNLGKELHSIGWDVMVRNDQPIFIEFNINNGFFVADHSMPELETMADFYSRNFLARVPHQLVNFNPDSDLNFDVRDVLPSRPVRKRR